MNFKNWIYKKHARLLLFAISFNLALATIEWWQKSPIVKKGQDYDEIWRSALIVIVYYSVSIFVHNFFSLFKVGFMKNPFLYFLLFVLYGINFLAAFIWYNPGGTTFLAIVSLVVQTLVYIFQFRNIDIVKKDKNCSII